MNQPSFVWNLFFESRISNSRDCKRRINKKFILFYHTVIMLWLRMQKYGTSYFGKYIGPGRAIAHLDEVPSPQQLDPSAHLCMIALKVLIVEQYNFPSFRLLATNYANLRRVQIFTGYIACIVFVFVGKCLQELYAINYTFRA